jgi:PIN domain nuclease of toxin-antitoxin system
MRYLLDTVVWLWSVGPTEKIGKDGLEILRTGGHEIYLSAASVWEISIKARSGKYKLPDEPARYIPNRLGTQGIRGLPISQTHALKANDLDLHHNDPFDRLIIAQALVENLTVLTPDQLFGKYPIEVVWCGK